MAIDWGPWEYSGGNGMRVGIEIDSVSSVTAASSSVTWTLKIYTENQYSYSDSQTLSYGGSISDEPNKNYTNGQGGTATLRDTVTDTYTYSTYGSSPGTRTWSATVSGAFNGVTPSNSLSTTIPERPHATPLTPTSPAHVRVSDTSNKITWVSEATEARTVDRYFIQRSVDGGAYSTISTSVSGSATSYTDSSASLNHEYIYRVAADNEVGTSSYATPGTSILTPPTAPTSVVRSSPGAGQQKIDWVNSPPAGYAYQTEIWVSQNGGAYSLLTTQASGVTTYTHNPAAGTSTWAYKARHKTNEGAQGTQYGVYSAETTTAAQTTTSAPNAPTSLSPSDSASQVTNSVIRLSWVHNPTDGSAQVKFTIRWRVVGGPTWTTMSEVTSANQYYDAPASTFTDNSNIEWQVQTEGAGAGLDSPFSASAIFVTVGDPNTARQKKRARVLDTETGKFETAPMGTLAPVGAVTQFAGANAPPGWLLCDGASLLRTDYPYLFAIIGTTYGAADGTHFTLPNLKGKVPVGFDTSQTEFDAIGESGGAKTHSHNLDTATSGARIRVAADNGIWALTKTLTSQAMTRIVNGSSNSATTSASSVGVALEGQSEVVSGLPPYLVMNYIIKT